MTGPGSAGVHRAAGGHVELSAEDQRRLVAALRRQLARLHAVDDVRTIETHISYVLLAGDTAYKLKKAIALPFVDYSTLARRRHFCDEELRLNGRLAPMLYRDVVALRGSVDAPVLDGTAPVVDYAVRMRAFDHGALLSERLAGGDLPAAWIDELSARVAAFHAGLPPAPAAAPFGAPAQVRADALDNFDEIAPLIEPSECPCAESLRGWTLAEFTRCEGAMAARKREGFVRECHGDLHLGNVALVDGAVTVFDGIEFNDQLRWIDVASEVAFAAMDLADRGRDDYAWRFLDGWLAATGDYGAVTVLRFYLVYRAMVRAKVRLLRAAQLRGGVERRRAREEAARYLALADRLAHDAAPALLITHGAAGAGKSTFSRALCERLGAIRLRTDVERKRLHGLASGAASHSTPGAGLYSAEATERTYAHVARVAGTIVRAGYTAIVDGTFLARAQRDRLRAVADEQGAAFVIVDVALPEALLRARVTARGKSGGDASEATLDVLEQQLARREPLGTDELPHVVAIDGTLNPADPDFAAVCGRVDVLRRRRAAPAPGEESPS